MYFSMPCVCVCVLRDTLLLFLCSFVLFVCLFVCYVSFLRFLCCSFRSIFLVPCVFFVLGLDTLILVIDTEFLANF